MLPPGKRPLERRAAGVRAVGAAPPRRLGQVEWPVAVAAAQRRVVTVVAVGRRPLAVAVAVGRRQRVMAG
jgi:hypothetical protein